MEITINDGTPLSELLIKEEISTLKEVLYNLTLKELLSLSHGFGKSWCVGYRSRNYIYVRRALNAVLKTHPKKEVRNINWEDAPTNIVNEFNLPITKCYGKYAFNEKRIFTHVKALIIFKLSNEVVFVEPKSIYYENLYF